MTACAPQVCVSLPGVARAGVRKRQEWIQPGVILPCAPPLSCCRRRSRVDKPSKTICRKLKSGLCKPPQAHNRLSPRDNQCPWRFSPYKLSTVFNFHKRGGPRGTFIAHIHISRRLLVRVQGLLVFEPKPSFHRSYFHEKEPR